MFKLLGEKVFKFFQVGNDEKIIRSETEEPSDGLSQIAARVLATSLPMYRKLLFTKLSPSLGNKQLRKPLPLTQQSAVELMFCLVVDGT